VIVGASWGTAVTPFKFNLSRAWGAKNGNPFLRTSKGGCGRDKSETAGIITQRVPRLGAESQVGVWAERGAV
jgi:hypothetical protein